MDRSGAHSFSSAEIKMSATDEQVEGGCFELIPSSRRGSQSQAPQRCRSKIGWDDEARCSEEHDAVGNHWSRIAGSIFSRGTDLAGTRVRRDFGRDLCRCRISSGVESLAPVETFWS